jgi:Zn-dependent M16 (insulinase) family peptidase
MSNILLDNSASPLKKALENSDLGKSLSPLTGLEADQKELVFAAGLEGVDVNKQKEVEDLVLNCLKELVKDGIPQDLIESSLHQLEIRQREITGSGMPFGLQIMLSCLPACIHNDDPLNILDLDSAFSSIKNNLKSNRYIERLIEKHLINNNHRLNYSLIPDTEHNKKNEEIIQQKVLNKTQNLSDDDKEKMMELAAALEARQEQDDDPEVLPKVTKDDIPKNRSYAHPLINNSNNHSNYFYKTGTNGIVYHSMLFPCNSLNIEELKIANLFTSTLTDIGLGSEDYELIQKQQSSVTGGISASFVMMPGTSDDNHKLALKISGKSLEKNDLLMQDLMLKTIHESNFSEAQRIKELLDFISSDNEQSLTQNGHALSMGNAAAQINTIASTNDLTSGLSFITNTNLLSREISNNGNLDLYIDHLRSIKSKISDHPSHSFLASSVNLNELNLNCDLKSDIPNISIQELADVQSESYGWITGSQVSFCAEAFPSVDSRHEDAPALTILGAVLRNGYLHSAIREKGGAYGSGASQDSHNKVFKFFSYRDPKCTDTFEEFDNSRKWSLENITSEQLDEGILGVISSIDKPLSPYGEAISDFINELDNKSQEDRLLFRSRIKDCTLDDLVKVSKKYLFGNSKKSVLAGESFKEEISKLGFDIKNI